VAGGAGFDLDIAVVRMRRIMWTLGAVGSLFLLAWRGAAWGLGFAVGSLISIASFHYTHRFVMALGSAGAAKPRTWKSVLLGARYLLIFGAVYAMMTVFGLNILAALCGLMIAAAAALLEILYEFIHGT